MRISAVPLAKVPSGFSMLCATVVGAQKAGADRNKNVVSRNRGFMGREPWEDELMERRELLKLIAGAALAPALPQFAEARDPARRPLPVPWITTAWLQRAIDQCAALDAGAASTQFCIMPGVYRLSGKLYLRGRVFVYGALMLWDSPGGGLSFDGGRQTRIVETVAKGPDFHDVYDYMEQRCDETGGSYFNPSENEDYRPGTRHDYCLPIAPALGRHAPALVSFTVWPPTTPL